MVKSNKRDHILIS